MKRLFSLAVALLGMGALGSAFVTGFSGFAQTTNGTIAGSVVDASQAAIVGAKVTAKSIETGDTRTATTNKVGGYRIEAVPPGNYRVEVTADTFAKTTVNGTAVN